MEICPACGGKEWREAYAGPVRSGLPGRQQDGVVDACAGCGLQHLREPSGPDYSEAAYRMAYNGTTDPEVLMEMHTQQTWAQVQLVGAIDGLMVVDIGCGHGAFLNAIRRTARCTVGIEPQASMHAHLLRRDINVFSSVPEFLAKWRVPRPADVVTSFGVIEHLDDPLAHLLDAQKVGRTGGVLWLQTDNLDDVLMKTEAPGFAQHFYRTAHRWYFSPATITRLFERAGFGQFRVWTEHEYGFDNFAKWHALGDVRSPDEKWKADIGAAGQGSLITVKVEL